MSLGGWGVWHLKSSFLTEARAPVGPELCVLLLSALGELCALGDHPGTSGDAGGFQQTHSCPCPGLSQHHPPFTPQAGQPPDLFNL